MWPINVNLRLLKAVDFVVDVDVIFGGVVVVAVVVVVGNVVVVALLLVTGHIIFICGQEMS